MFRIHRTIKTPKIVKKKRRILFFKLCLLALIIGGVVAGLSWASHAPQMQVKNVVIEGNETIRSGDLESAVWDTLHGNYLWLFSKRNAFVYPHATLKKNILETHKEISFLELELEGLHTLHLRLKEREARYLWCADESSEEEVGSEGCYYVDQGGYVFLEAPYFSGTVFIKLFGPLNSGDVVFSVKEETVSTSTSSTSTSTPVKESAVGKYFLNPTIFGNILAFVKALDDVGVQTASLSVDQYGDTHLQTKVGTGILFRSEDEVGRTIANMQASLNSDAFSGEKLSERLGQAEFLDVRFGNKVFYRMK